MSPENWLQRIKTVLDIAGGRLEAVEKAANAQQALLISFIAQQNEKLKSQDDRINKLIQDYAKLVTQCSDDHSKINAKITELEKKG